jgi:uncharacterized membrane protein
MEIEDTLIIYHGVDGPIPQTLADIRRRGLQRTLPPAEETLDDAGKEDAQAGANALELLKAQGIDLEALGSLSVASGVPICVRLAGQVAVLTMAPKTSVRG